MLGPPESGLCNTCTGGCRVCPCGAGGDCLFLSSEGFAKTSSDGSSPNTLEEGFSEAGGVCCSIPSGRYEFGDTVGIRLPGVELHPELDDLSQSFMDICACFLPIVGISVEVFFGLLAGISSIGDAGRFLDIWVVECSTAGTTRLSGSSGIGSSGLLSGFFGVDCSGCAICLLFKC